jgi:hypothetical protein
MEKIATILSTIYDADFTDQELDQFIIDFCSGVDCTLEVQEDCASNCIAKIKCFVDEILQSGIEKRLAQSVKEEAKQEFSSKYVK